MSLDPELRRRLTIRRITLQLSQRDLAAAMNCSVATIWQLETGKSDPRLSTIRRWAAALGVQQIVIDVPPAVLEDEEDAA